MRSRGRSCITPQLLEYLSRFRDGTASNDAFRTAFGGEPAVLDRELRDYVSQVSMTRLRITFDDQVNTAIPERVEKIDDLQADTYLGDLQARLDRIDEARARPQKVLALRPGTARATHGLGLIELRAERMESAIALLERAAEGPDDGQVQGAFGRALMSRLFALQPTSEEYDVRFLCVGDRGSKTLEGRDSLHLSQVFKRPSRVSPARSAGKRHCD